MPRRAIDEVELQVMRLLHEVAQTSGGWLRGGVRGWVLGYEVGERAGCFGASDAMRRLRELAWVRSDVVRDPGRPTRPMLLWRITQFGEDLLAAYDSREPVRLPPPRTTPGDEGMLFLSRQAWACLSVLQRLPGAVRSTELCAEARRRFRVWLYPDDVQALVKRGFVQRENRRRGEAAETWLSVTSLGRRVELIDGRSSASLVQLRIAAGADGHRNQ